MMKKTPELTFQQPIADYLVREHADVPATERQRIAPYRLKAEAG
jgi:hypothetical protein